MAFSKTVFSFEVKEDTAPGTVVGKVETVFKGLTDITYSVQEDDGENLLLLSPLSGEFLLSRSLDYEAKSFYILTVAVQQGDSQVSRVRVYFNVLDVNDNPPLFSQETFSASLLEDTRVGACFLSLKVSDEDDGENGDLKLRVVDGDEEDVFFINSAGSLCLKTALDRERQSSYNLTVTANDCVQPVSLQLTSSARVVVLVDDINDNAPLFVSATMFNIPEDTSLHSVVMTVHAEDKDIGSNGEVLYHLNNTSEGLFRIDNRSGKIYLEEELDREQVDTLTITVIATDKGTPRMETTMNLTVHIEDVNDNDPEFLQSTYSVTVREDIRRGTSLFQVHALDGDSGKNGQVRYRLTQTSPFAVDSVRGVVMVMDKLDREMHSNYNLIITVVDLGSTPRSATAAISVTVLDVNDFVPRFTPETLTINVLENEEDPSQLIHQVSAADEDLGVNSQLTYFIRTGNSDGLFSITPSGTFQILQSLDREREPLYQVTIMAVDSGLPPLTGALTINIIVDDINDNRPEFTEEIYNTIVSEDSPTGTVFAMITASDIDEGINGEIRYSLENLDVPFAIDETSGELFTTNVLDRETVSVYILGVIGSDKHPTEPLSSSVLVTVLIGDVNDHWPQFMNSPYVAYVPTEMAPGSVVCAVKATDGDTDMNAELHYSLYGQSSDLFSIHPYSGTVFTSNSLQRTEDIIVNVHVEDAGENPKFDITTISIRFQNISEFPEMKVDVLSYILSEDEPVGTLVAVVSATSTRADPVSFYLASGNFEDVFHVEQLSGALTVENPLDYESKKEFTLLIEARDSGSAPFSSFEEIHINISDVNDNFPQFTQAEYRCEMFENSPPSGVCDVLALDADSSIYGTVQYNITEDVNEFKPMFSKKELNFSVFKNVPAGTVIGKVTATDDDQGPEGQVFYLMFGQNKYMGFEIHKISGEIFTTRSLRSQGNSHIDFKVLAKNPGVITGANVDETLVRVTVIDTNEAPVFTSVLYVANVSEDSPIGTSVITVSALDEDSILDWYRLFFNIENGNTNSSFAVNPSSGVISVISLLDRELWSYYNLTLTATDNGSPPATGTTNVIITINDVNDNAPKLTFTEARVKENQPQGTVVARLTASDSDLMPNQGPFTYLLVNPSTDSAFSLSPDGVLVTTRTIDREQIELYQVLVAVMDSGIPQQSSTEMFHIKILDENDNPSMPRNIFIEVKYFGSSFQGGIIGNVHPEDQDESDTFNCAIKSGSHNMFTITNGTCELWSSSFQGEATFNITVEATDQLHFPVNNSIYVNYKGFTNASIDSCILFYVSISSLEEFVSNNYLRFVKALDSLFNLQASKTHVFGIKQIGGEILLLAAVKNYNGRYLSKEVASGISTGHKRLLEVQSNVTISHITSDPCLNSPCQNRAKCNKNIFFSQEVAVLESEAVIFVSPQKEVFNCTCPVGFTGILCEDDIDECEVNPCENKGTCVNTPGSFYCHCQSGFSGSVCSADVDECLRVKCQNGATCSPTQDGYQCQCLTGFEGEMCEQFIDHCRSTPCVQGNCTNTQTGFSCHCPFGVSGDNCEEHSYGFEELSFMTFPPLDRRINLISLDFATMQRDSLLLYNPGGSSSSRDFFALEILDGSIHLLYDLGSGPVRLQTNKQVVDGYFHSVTVRRIGSMGSVNVDNCTDTENSGFCFSQSDGSSLERTLDVGSNMTFGGLRSAESILLHPAQIKTHDFVGCIRNIHVNGILLRPSMALSTYNILDRCPRSSPSQCHSNPCKNGGTCHDLWSDFLCECKSPFTGSNCATEMSEELVLRFSGIDYIQYVIKERFKRDYLLKKIQDTDEKEDTRNQNVLNIKFKTQDDGVLIFIVHQTGSILLKIKDRKPLYISKDTLSGHLSEFTVDSPVADGVWHVLSWFRNGQKMFLLLDGIEVLNITDQRMDLTPLTVEKIVLGATLTGDSTLKLSGLIGCVQYFNMSGHSLPVSGHSMMVDVWPSPSLLQSNCSSSGVCHPSPCSDEDTARSSCLTAHCKNRWRCRPDAQNRSCICFHNVSDHTCDVCISTAESLDGCSEAQGSGPLWLIAVILPLISILVIIGMVAVQYKARRQNATCTSDSTQQKSEQGTDNAAFCFNDNRSAQTGQEKSHDPMSADQQKLGAAEFYCEASLSSIHSLLHSEPEYYEIGSISTASHSKTASLKLNFHKHLDSKEGVTNEPKHGGDLRMLLAGFSDERSHEVWAKKATKHQNMSSLNKQMLVKIETENAQHTPPCNKSFIQPEFLEPAQCLTLEEISKLNNPLEQRIVHQASPRSSMMMEVSSESDTDSTFTGAEFDRELFSVINDRKFTHDQSSLTTHSFRKQGILSLDSRLNIDSHSAAAQHNTESSPYTTFEQWGNIFNMHLPFSSYAPVFEDIACLHTEHNHNYDIQSDIEEII
ncbi:protocadherin Fat 4 [Tautogolabrus adspersus]